MTKHQQHLLTDEEKAYVARVAEDIPPATDEEIRFLRALIASNRRESKKSA
jgi:hypothetical protein